MAVGTRWPPGGWLAVKTKRLSCSAKTRSGARCKAQVRAGADRCKWHSRDPATKARHLEESRKGGLSKAYGALPAGAPLADTLKGVELDLGRAEGVSSLLAATLTALAQLPFDVRVANA